VETARLAGDDEGVSTGRWGRVDTQVLVSMTNECNVKMPCCSDVDERRLMALF
jgi:hypothetical protein